MIALRWISIFALLIFLSGCGEKIQNTYNPAELMEALGMKRGPSSVDTMSFAVFGDTKGSSFFPEVLKHTDQMKPDFCLTTADLVKTGGGEKGKSNYLKLEKQASWFFKKYPTWPTVGNHETYGGHDAIKNFNSFFGINTPLYSFEYGNAKFIALSWRKVKKSKEDLQWLENELKDTRAQHKFIFLHRPFYTVGVKSKSDVEGEDTVTTKLFQKYGVKAVFSGHDHIYYRTKRNGVHYVISAGAGAEIYELARESEAKPGDVYYGKVPGKQEYKFHAEDSREEVFKKPFYYVFYVQIKGDRVTFKMSDTSLAKVWDEGTFD